MRKTLDRPTVAELVAVLQGLPQGMPVRICDPDTRWTIHQIITEVDNKGVFWLTGEYMDMNGEADLPPKELS